MMKEVRMDVESVLVEEGLFIGISIELRKYKKNFLIVASYQSSKYIFISSMIRRTSSAKQLDPKHSPKISVLANHSNILHRLYQESVSSIIDQRNFLQLAPDTVFLAIQILRKFLLAESNLSSCCTKPLYLACISLASKLNEITPPMMEELEELEDFFIEVRQIVSMEERILKVCNYCLPITENILSHLWEQISKPDQKFAQKYEKVLYRTLSDPFFVRYCPRQIARALIIFQELQNNGKQISKSIDMIIGKMKHLMSGKAMPSLKDLNIHSG